MPATTYGSLTKEPPLGKLDATIALIRPGMLYPDLLELAREHTHSDAPGLLRSRFLHVDDTDRVLYDRFLSLVASYGVDAALVRKVMYFTWAWRDERVRRFICEQIADANGLWRSERLTDKSRSQFFHEWFARSSATKARSNIEYFLVEAKIFNPVTHAINLELDDGWLAEAMLVAAQHEPDRALRGLMASDPIGTLTRLRLNGLANMPALPPGTIKAQPIADIAQLPADADTADYRRSQPKRWSVRERKPLSRASTEVVLDLVALERANVSHAMLERIADRAISARDCDAQCNEAIDMYFETSAGVTLLEVKSCHAGNIHSQTRRGVSQLLEYRFIFEPQLGKVVALILFLEIEPPAKQRWLVEYLRTIGITLAWKGGDGAALITSLPIPEALAGFVHAELR